MPTLPDFNAFNGRHPETGSIHNALAYQGVIAPHTGEPVSEALLMGISGGVAFGYFTFEYSGYRPHIALLTRNTFDPLDTLLTRMPLPHEVLQSGDPEKGMQNLLDTLEDGRPAIVWADRFLLPYNDLPYDEHNWAMAPVLVYGVEDGQAMLADRAGVPCVVDVDTLKAARARVKKDRNRIIMLDTPDLDRLPTAVSQAIWATIAFFTEGPPKGKKTSFGLAGLEHWSKLLTGTRNQASWTRYFPPGERLWMALVGDRVQSGAFDWLYHGTDNGAERGMYADFIDEAAMILDKPGLSDVAGMYRESASAWDTLAEMLLPADVAMLAEAKSLLKAKHSAFITQGSEAADEIHDINEKLEALRLQASDDFPISDDDVNDFYTGLAAQVDVIREIEGRAIDGLQSVMA